MVVVVSVAYKAGKFDMDYYIKSHMPLVQKSWAAYGLKSWKVAHFTNPEAPYAVEAWLEFDDVSQWEKASTSAEANTVFGDIPNFTDVTPDKSVGTLTGFATS